jgi:hypothetical protein
LCFKKNIARENFFAPETSSKELEYRAEPNQHQRVTESNTGVVTVHT